METDQRVANRKEATYEPVLEGESIRLNRFLARAGVASRRKSDLLIQSGQVRVNGEAVSEPGRSVVVGRDRVECQGRIVVLPERFEYLIFHKPAGCLVTRRDPRGRPTVFDWLGALHPGTVAVGRLDRDTTGLLLLTDDGKLAHRLMHPGFEIDKEYEAVVQGRPGASDLDRLRRGIDLDDGKTAPARVEQVDARGRGREEVTRVRISIHEGRKRQVRRMFEAIGHPVLELKRISFAGLGLGSLREGRFRHLTDAEVEKLKSRVGLSECAGRKD